MLYLKIDNTVIEFKGFTMTHYSAYNSARFAGALSDDQNIDDLQNISNNTIIEGITLYSDPNCTEVFWSDDRNFKLENITESYIAGNPEISKMFDLVVC